MKTETRTSDYSIVIPVYFNEGRLENTLNEIKTQVIEKQPGREAEILFVDDGSGDGSLRELLDLQSRNANLVKVIKLTRNFGQVSAIRAGMTYARGQCVVVMSADGQDPATLINDMLTAHFKEHFEVVVCARSGREESAYRIWTSRLFYALMRKLSFPGMPLGGFDFMLLGRRAVDMLTRNRESHPFLQGQVLWMGFRTKVFEYERHARRSGVSRWTFGRKLTYLLDGLLSYSFLPIRLVSVMGLAIALMGFAYALVVLLLKLLCGNPVKGWTPLMIVMLVLGGFQMLTLGIFGEYMWRILAQVQNREPYIVDEKYGFENP